MFSVHHTMSNHVYIYTHTYIEVSLNYIIFYTLFHYTHYNFSLLTRVWHSQLSSMCPRGLTGQSQRPPIEACSVASTMVRVRWATASANRRCMALAELVHHLLYLTHPLVKLHQQLYTPHVCLCVCLSVCIVVVMCVCVWCVCVCVHIRTLYMH